MNNLSQTVRSMTMRSSNMPLRNALYALLIVVSLLMLSGCSMTLPVRASMQGDKEIFTGTATGYLDGSGNITIESSNGTTCTGNFVYVTRRQGEGVISCDDGRSGPFEFVSTGSRGTGHGELDGEGMTFTFGRH